MVEWRILVWIQIESCRKMVKLVRTGHKEVPSFPEQLYKCNFLAFMFICRSVRYIPDRYVSSHNHSAMDNQRMSWNVLSWVWSKARHLSDPFVSSVWGPAFLLVCCTCVCVCTSAPSLAHAGFLGLGHPVILGRHGHWSEVTWNDQSAIRESAVGGGGWGGVVECCLRTASDWETAWETTGGVDRWDRVCASEGGGGWKSLEELRQSVRQRPLGHMRKLHCSMLPSLSRNSKFDCNKHQCWKHNQLVHYNNSNSIIIATTWPY